MIFSHIINYFNQTSQSIGLPTLVLVFIISLSFFFFILGLVVLSKIRKIRIELIDTTQHLHSLIQRLQADKEHLKTDNYNLKAANDHPKIELQKHGEKNRNFLFVQVRPIGDYNRLLLHIYQETFISLRRKWPD